jgi:anaerobic ribonucleoside-triphosphate reductase activating protein
MKIYKILKNTTVEGPGQRFCIWVQGCKKHCKGCFAKETWDFESGEIYCVKELYNLIKAQNNIEGVTFLGGEPFEQAKELSELSKMVKRDNLSVLCFTGYTLEELELKKDRYVNEFLSNIDLLIDGGFEQEHFDISRPWVGSSNQRFIFLTDRYCENDLKKYKNKIELHLDYDGKIEINGMGDFAKLERDFCLQLSKNIVK